MPKTLLRVLRSSFSDCIGLAGFILLVSRFGHSLLLDTSSHVSRRHCVDSVFSCGEIWSFPGGSGHWSFKVLLSGCSVSVTCPQNETHERRAEAVVESGHVESNLCWVSPRFACYLLALSTETGCSDSGPHRWCPSGSPIHSLREVFSRI